MARGTPEQNAAKWAQRLSASTQQIQQGVANVTEAPGKKAAAQVQSYLNGIQAKVDKWQRNVGRVSLEEWKAATTAGAARVAQGAQAKQGKVESFQREFLPFLDQVQRRVSAMPRGTLEQNLARMVENARGISQFKRSG